MVSNCVTCVVLWLLCGCLVGAVWWILVSMVSVLWAVVILRMWIRFVLCLIVSVVVIVDLRMWLVGVLWLAVLLTTCPCDSLMRTGRLSLLSCGSVVSRV